MSDQTVPTDILRTLLDGSTPVIATSWSDGFSDDELADARRAGLDVAELRIDRFSTREPDHVAAVARRFDGLPTIATIRTRADGGEWDGTDRDRADLFRAVLPLVDAVDVELASLPGLGDVVDEARRLDRVVIVSHHDFDRTPGPDELERLDRSAREHGADLVKVATMCRSVEDLRTLARFTLGNAELGVIVIGMGRHGSASRALFPSLGSRLAFAATTHPVPGQLTYERTVELLREFSPDFDDRKAAELGLLDGT